MKKAWMLGQCQKIALVCSVLSCLLVGSGCEPNLSSPDQVRKFDEAGLLGSEVDIEGLEKIKNNIGPYRVESGDLLELQMPAVLQVISSDLPNSLQKVESYSCRVRDDGKITLPIVGWIPVVGKTEAEVESSIINAYYPKYVVSRPMVVCEVGKYRNENKKVFTVLGLVNHPNTFPYPPDVQYNLMEALAFAGGFDMVADPRYLKVFRRGPDGNIVSACFSTDKKSLPDAYNVVIKPGDVVYVDHTLRTRTNTFLADVFQVRVGADYYNRP